MVKAKKTFKETETELAELLDALAHPARIAILSTLAKRGECICGEIVEIVPLAQSTVSQHLKKLRETGLIQGQIEGAKSCYCLDPKGVQRLTSLFRLLQLKLESGLPAEGAPVCKALP